MKTRRISREELPEHCREMADGDYVETRCATRAAVWARRSCTRVFQPVFHHQRTRLARATGLGLSVVQDILIIRSGAVSAQSKPGEGSCFGIYLPVTIGVCAVQIQRQPEKRGGGQADFISP